MANRRGKKIDFTRWTDFSVSASALAAGSVASNAGSAGTGTETLMRTRGQLCAWIDGLEAPATSIVVSVGLIVMPEGQGSTVVSEPFADGNAPWFYFTRFTLGYEEYVTDAIAAPGLSVYRETLDVKAMRILRADREVQFVVTNTTLISAASVNVSLTGRFLIGS